MEKNIGKQCGAYERTERLKKIALELLQQLKGRQLDFEDAEMVLRRMRSLLEQEKNSRLL